ncbi:expressed unknown protein [Seminavis robusta]|uniref:Uncharacterized protein n=1 Tax=Seminavis robusta TaxID=568900 RepID=A0A9N8DEB3_9STRA|nr:expressed unknown protein [Seminavis robusta]|eukprot:Sro99_g051050.1 n/a (459) ;mRNA; f:106635-108011
MSQSNSRKRKTCSSSGSTSQDDLPQDESTRSAMVDDNHGMLDKSLSSLDSTSLEYLLAVPLEIIFRQIPTPHATCHGKPLLARAEARCLLQIVSLSQEWDVLFAAANDSLEQRAWSRQFQLKLISSESSSSQPTTQPNKSHPYLRPLVPLLQVQGQYNTTKTLRILDREMHTVLTQLHHCSQSLQQFAEHNWTLSDNLLDVLGAKEQDYLDNSQQQQSNDTKMPKGAVLAREKRRLAELQEEICQRIEALVQNMHVQGQEGAPSDDEEEGDGTDEQNNEKPVGIDSLDVSMATICAQLWKLPNLATLTTSATTTGNGKDQQEQQQSTKVGLFSYPEPMEEENNNNNKEPSSYSTPMTMPGMDDPSIQQQQQQQQQNDNKPSGANLSDDDDETVMDENVVMEEPQKQSDHSQHSIVSNDQDDHQQQVTHSVGRNLSNTESQMQKFDAGEALVMFACQGS